MSKCASADEMQKLIAEQRRDMLAGSVVRHEPFVAISLDAFSDPTDVETISRLVHPPECSIHGYREVVIQPSGWWHCRACHREYATARRRERGARPRRLCPHNGAYQQTSRSGRSYCGECARRRSRLAKMEHANRAAAVEQVVLERA